VNEADLVLFEDDTNLLIIERDENILQYKVNEVIKNLEYWLKKKHSDQRWKNGRNVISYKTE